MARRGFPGMGLPGGMNINKLLKEAQKMQSDMQKSQKEIQEKTFESVAGGGAVTARMNGKRELLEINVAEELLDKDEKEMLQDVLMVCINDLLRKIDEEDYRIYDIINTDKVIGILNKIDIKQNIDLTKFSKIEKWIEISALSKIGIDNLENEIYKYIMNENVEDSSQKLVITNVRHKSALEKTNEALLNIIETIDMGLPMDLMAVDIKDALDSLSEVTGEISSEDLLDHIFSNFCVGK